MKTMGLSRRDFLLQGTVTAGLLAANSAIARAAPLNGANGRKVLHIIGHSHIDAAWLWPWRDGADTVLNTFRSALNRMKENAQFCYSHSSSMHTVGWNVPIRRCSPRFASGFARAAGRW
jgi:alpha-mannosidase